MARGRALLSEIIDLLRSQETLARRALKKAMRPAPVLRAAQGELGRLLDRPPSS